MAASGGWTSEAPLPWLPASHPQPVGPYRLPVLRVEAGAVIRSVAFPVIVSVPAVLVLGWMVAPHVTQGLRSLRDSRSGRLTADAIAELREWRRRRRNPRPVAAFGHPREDESLWLTTVPLKHLSRPAVALRRMYRKGRLTGENITRARVVRQELRRRLRAADSPNRAVMDQLDDSELGFIRQQLNAEETT